MIALTNEQIERIRKRAEEDIRDKYGNELQLFVRQYKVGEYIEYAIQGTLTAEELTECSKIITRTGSVIAKVYLDEGYGN